MNVCIATDFHIVLYNNRYYLKTQLSTIIKRYYSVFGKLDFCGRVFNLEDIDDSLEDVTEMIREISVIPSWNQLFSKKFKKEIKDIVLKSDLIIARCPGIISNLTVDIARKLGKKCFAECMACTWDALWNHSLKGKIVAPYMFFKMKQVVKNADYALYVTDEFLQKRYPTTGKNIGISNVKIAEISNEVIGKRLEKIKETDKKNITFLTSAAVNVKYKGQEYVIKAIRDLNEAGINVTYKLAGGGSNERLLNIAKKYGVEKNVIFLGSLPHDEVFKNLDKTDIYVQPSLQEGLPRALVEALSRGCICIGARTGGIPELLQDRFVLRRKSVKDIVNAVKSICEKEDWEEISKENFEKAREYEETKLDEKRNEFYKMLKEEIEQ